jgi:hypothetical protein
MAKKTTANHNLNKAKDAKADEFYTQLTDIENELRHYKKHFRGKVVYCNCDDPKVSEFYRYFFLKFEDLGLKRLVTTCYKSDDAGSRSKSASKHAVCIEYDLDGETHHRLEGDGDFRSPECVARLEQSDIVVTNPPFSLFREFVAQLVEHGKKFLIIGHQNAITYKEIFPLIKECKIWLGYGFNGGAAHFTTHYEDHATASNHIEGMVRVSGVNWFTNLDIAKRHEDLILYKKYTPKEYPKYDNYDAINVDKTKDIPVDYNGAIGVPITFLDKYNPTQFEIVKFRKGDDDRDLTINGKSPYFRIIIKRRPQ